MKIHAKVSLILFMSLSVFWSIAHVNGQTAEVKTSAVGRDVAKSIVWQPYADGLAQAGKFKKPAFIDFYTDWCHWCHELDRTTYKDARVIRLLNEKFIPIKVDAESKNGVTYASRYPIRGYPSLWFVAPTGEIIMPIQGFVPAESLLPVLVFIGDGYYAKTTYDDFMKQQWPKLKGSL